MTTRNGISHTPLRRRPFEGWTVDTVVVGFTLAAGALVLNPWWVRPRAALVKAVFEQGRAVTPGPAYAAAAASVDVIPNVVVSAPAVPSASVSPPHLRGVILFCGFYDMRTVGDSGFPALQTMLWSYTGHRDWATYPRIDELSTTDHLTPRYPPVFLSVGDADPFETQAIELQAALEQAGVASTTLLWHRSERQLPHEYQFDFRRPEAEQAFAATLRFLRERSSR